MSKNGQNHGVRADIQALRALAIASVLIFHVWPTALTGGFVGVDVFFVISGYLITGQLWRQQQKTGSVNFADFWSRRARRLLPASLLAIAVTTAATYLLATPSWFLKVSSEGLGATVYGQNWVLISKVTNYLTNDGTKSPFQHFWSLSVEEQYYIVWPLILGVVLLLVRRISALRSRIVLLTVLAAILVASLGYSIQLTALDPQNAYFNTFTRAWEFAAGALLAIGTGAQPKSRKFSPVFFWLGTGLMLYAIVYFNQLTPFPSWYAGIPVAGAVMSLYGGASTSKWLPNFWLRFRPVQFIGDISYSLYLWHWPVLILATWALHRATTFSDQIGIVVISVLLGWISKRFVEDPVRFGALSRLKPSRQLFSAAAGMVLVLAVGFGFTHLANVKFTAQSKAFSLTPPLNHLNRGYKGREDFSCYADVKSDQLVTCAKGDLSGALNVALMGDSHTRQWFPAIDDVAFKYHWHLTLISKSGCTVMDPALIPANLVTVQCRTWNTKLAAYLKTTKAFDLVINSNSTLVTLGRADAASAYRGFVKSVLANGHTRFIVIHDSPKPDPNFVSCIETWQSRSAVKCAVSRATGLTPPDVLPAAIKDLPRVQEINLTNYFCSLKNCPPIHGRTIIYRDNSHITSTWAKYLEPELAAAIPAEFKK